MKRVLVLLVGTICVLPLCAQSFPEKFEGVEGFNLLGEKQYFDKNNLYDYINGASDFYLGYNFQDLWVVDYAIGTKQTVTLELYRMEDDLYSFGIYSEERPQAAEVMSIGAEGFVDGNAVFFLAANYYVKVYNGQPGVEDEALIDFAIKIARVICDSCSLPGQLLYFPIEGKVLSSERYMAENFMGITGFDGVFTAQYKIGDEECRLFVYKGDDDLCRQFLDRYFDRVKHRKKLKEKLYSFNDPYLGMVKLSYRKGFVFGILDAKDPEMFLELYTTFQQSIE